MAARYRSGFGLVLGTVACVCLQAGVTAAQGWSPTRTPDGQPDIQGTWVNFDSTPFEAPGAGPQQAPGNAAVNPDPDFAIH